MSSSYAGVKAIGAIPGEISISDSENHIEMHSGEAPPVTMTKQTALMLVRDNKPHGFVITQKGIQQFRHLAEGS